MSKYFTIAQVKNGWTLEDNTRIDPDDEHITKDDLYVFNNPAELITKLNMLINE